MMTFNISSLPHFYDNELQLDTNVCFFYGRNGTGKTSLALQIKKNCISDDCSCFVFSGFESIISENKKLKALVMGEKNVEIDNKVNSLVLQRTDLIKEKNDIIKGITPPPEGENNFFSKRKSAESDFDITQGKIRKLESKFAAEIKKYSPQIAPPSYNIKNFHDEVKNATLLSNDKIKELISLLRSEVKVVKEKNFLLVDFQKILNDVNELLIKRVVEKKIITRFQNSPERIRFAQKGLDLHKADDICAFCGNKISKDCILELRGYFSANDVSIFQNELNEKEKLLSNYLSSIDSLSINPKDFYPDLNDSITILSNELNSQKKIVSDFLNKLIVAISHKKTELFTESPILEIDVPKDFSDIARRFNLFKQQNNSNNLQVKQDEARELLRYHEIQKAINDHTYVQLQTDLKRQEINKTIAQNAFNSEQDKVSGPNGLDEKISDIDRQIEELKKQTLNEKILADTINKKLKRYVSFELVHSNESFGEGYYLVKDLVTKEIRDISEVSTGERNIIAFLYFIGKIKSGSENREHSRIIIFDDPMNSNDDVMQYIIIDELQRLTEPLSENDSVYIFTHNKHFYLNVSHGFEYFNGKTKNNKRKDASFIHLFSDTRKTTIEYIRNKDDDFKTNYDSLWQELKFLFNCKSANAELLLNPIRRIIETFIKFNSSSYRVFFSKNQDA